MITQVLAIHQMFEDKDIGTINVTPIDEPTKSKTYKPFVTIHFKEDEDRLTGKSGLNTGEVSFRLMNETSESITQVKINKIAEKIEQIFDTSNKYVWRKGKQYVTYRDLEQGYQFQILCPDKSEAKDLIKNVLLIQNHTYEPKNLKVHIDEDEASNYPSNPGTIRILGETVEKPKLRPSVSVRFTHATIQVWARRKPVTIVDTRKRSEKAS